MDNFISKCLGGLCGLVVCLLVLIGILRILYMICMSKSTVKKEEKSYVLHSMKDVDEKFKNFVSDITKE